MERFFRKLVLPQATQAIACVSESIFSYPLFPSSTSNEKGFFAKTGVLSSQCYRQRLLFEWRSSYD